MFRLGKNFLVVGLPLLPGIARNCYGHAAVGMPLAFTQEDFLVIFFCCLVHQFTFDFDCTLTVLIDSSRTQYLYHCHVWNSPNYVYIELVFDDDVLCIRINLPSTSVFIATISNHFDFLSCEWVSETARHLTLQRIQDIPYNSLLLVRQNMSIISIDTDLIPS